MKRFRTTPPLHPDPGSLNPEIEELQYLIDSMGINDIWRVFRIMSEFSESFEALSRLPDAVTIFGSARTPESDPNYAKARELGARIARKGFAVVTGGGPGIMEAANRGAHEAGGVSVGLNIDLPFEQKPNPYITYGLDYHYFFVRKVMLVKYAVAFVIFPGGYGTLDELFESLTLIQTRRIKPFPIVLFGVEYWGGLIDWIKKRALAEGNISPEDLALFHCTDSLDIVMDVIASSSQITHKIESDRKQEKIDSLKPAPL